MTQRASYRSNSPEGMKALGAVYAYVGDCGLEKTLVDLVYLRASQINGCAYCIDELILPTGRSEGFRLIRLKPSCDDASNGYRRRSESTCSARFLGSRSTQPRSSFW